MNDQVTPDTPESVAEKMAQIPVIIDMWNHYLVADHPGDYVSCEQCAATREART